MNLVEFRINLPLFAQPDDVFAKIIRHFNIRATEQLLEDPELRQTHAACDSRRIQNGE